ncbi:hypothetical protein NSK_000774 [Nannochloropsis salina CCMP1776]|uniref:NADH-cytochrome b5 reductase n=1 Tax=Nannochloropsis salina CCMP1776 TaxID=1027361 RepID=A0A4D9DFI5_9STRA|nr:hypothetical protein NSK_000774 [Nannochloropsis salina CCMP1776]|eukprot:TFJ88425.1 hypothetical protein NSK_000774 [Nannochloropsis salina CCMP1776]
MDQVAPFLQENGVAVAAGVLVVLATVAIMTMQSPPKRKRPSGPVALNPDNYLPFKLVEREELTHNTRRFRFALQSSQHVLGLPVGQHVSLKYTDSEGKDVTRSYTPISSDDDLGYVDFAIKVYFANTHPKFPEGGKMSQHLEALQLGDSILMRGPKGSLTYHGRGQFALKSRGVLSSRTVSKVGMIAGGTGITPMLQVIREMLKDKGDKTKVWLLYANQTENDILLQEELEEIAQHHPDRFKLYYTLDRPPTKWKQGIGFVTADMIKNNLPPPSSSSFYLVCGPPAMLKLAVIPAFEKEGIAENQYYTY